MKTRLMLFFLTLACALFFAGCASAPTAEIDATKAALAAVRTGDVQDYAPESLKTAEDELSKALAEVEAQDGKFALSRDYKQASAALKSAKNLAEKARNEAEANKIKARADVEAVLASLPQLMDDAKKVLAKAPKGKDTKADLEAMQNDLKTAEDTVAEANQAIYQGKYKDALAKGNSAREKASAVIEQVKQAQEKMKGGRTSR